MIVKVINKTEVTNEDLSQYKKLMGSLEQQLKELVIQSREVLPKGLSGLGKERFTKKRRSNAKRKQVDCNYKFN